jgi:hypothetical protein
MAQRQRLGFAQGFLKFRGEFVDAHKYLRWLPN